MVGLAIGLGAAVAAASDGVVVVAVAAGGSHGARTGDDGAGAVAFVRLVVVRRVASV